MPIPLIVWAGGLILTTVAGAGAGAKGGADLARAKRTVKDCQSEYERAFARYTLAESEAADAVLQFNQLRAKIQDTTLTAWVDWLAEHEHQVRRLPHETVSGVKLERPNLPRLKRLYKPAGLAAGGAQAAVAGVMAQQAALAAVRTFAVASTGTAISSLTGAAAQSATLAWLGGGTLAAGGGGVAAGGMVLTGVAIAPAVLLGGITLAVQGDKALTQAAKYRKDVNVAIARIDTAIAMFAQLMRRIAELTRAITDTNSRARDSLAALAALEFDPRNDAHVESFQKTALSMRALSELLETPLVDQHGRPDSQGEAA